MSQSLGSIHVELTSNTAQFVEGMSKAAVTARKTAGEISAGFSKVQSVAGQVASGLSSINPAIGGVASAIANAARAASDASKNMGSMGSTISTLGIVATSAGAALATLGAGTVAVVMHTAESAAKMYEQSQMAGVSTEALSRLSFAAERVGVSQESVVTALERMSRAAVASLTATRGAANPFRDLGISVKDAAGQMKPADELFAQVAGRLGAMTDITRRTALEIQLFGRSGAELGPLLQLGADGIEKLRAESDRLNLTISTQTGKAAEEFETNMKHLQEVSEGFANSLTSHLLPKLNDVIANLSLMKGSDLASAYTTLLVGPTVNPLGIKPLSRALSTPAAIDPLGVGALGLQSKAFVPPDPAKLKAAEEAANKLAEALKSVEEKLQEEGATAGSTSAQIELYRLHMLDAGPEQLKFIAKLQRIANAAEIAAGKLGNVKMKPSEESISALATLHDKYSGLSADGAKWVSNLEQQRAALDAVVDAAAPFRGMSVDLGTIGAAIGAQDQPKSYTDISLQAAQDAGLRIERTGSKGFGFSENLPQLEDMRTALASVGESTLLVDAAIQSGMDRMVSKIDQAAMSVGTLNERFKGLLGTIAEDGSNLGGKLFDSMSKGIDDISDQLAHLVVTGQSSFKKMFEGLGESALKSSFQSGFGELAKVALGGKSGATGSLASTVTGAFGIKLPGADGKKPAGTSGDPIYVAFSNISGGVDPLKGILPALGKGGTTPPFLPSISKLFSGGGSSPTTPFGDFGGSLQTDPASPDSSGAIAQSSASAVGSIAKLISSLTSDSSDSSSSSSGSGSSGIGGIFGSILSIFGGFRAAGGDVTPGKTYIVGEKHPEFFTPKTAGTVSPSLTMGGGSHQTVVNMHIHGVQDADSFRRSQTQIYANLHAQLALANSRG